MNKKYLYTLFSLGIAAIFLFGSMKMMLSLLSMREADLLSEEGKVIIESPVRAWGENEKENFDETTEKYVLTMEQIEAAVNSWNNREWETIHNPVDGQLSLENAIEEGKSWLIDMGIFTEESEDFAVNATLGLGNQKKLSDVQVEPFYSFWTVEFTSQSKRIILYINAVSGNVYGAEIILYDNLQDAYSYETLELFVESSDLNGTELVIYEDKKQAIIPIENSGMAARMKVSIYRKPYYNLLDENRIEEYVGIKYELVQNEK